MGEAGCARDCSAGVGCSWGPWGLRRRTPGLRFGSSGRAPASCGDAVVIRRVPRPAAVRPGEPGPGRWPGAVWPGDPRPGGGSGGGQAGGTRPREVAGGQAGGTPPGRRGLGRSGRGNPARKAGTCRPVKPRTESWSGGTPPGRRKRRRVGRFRRSGAAWDPRPVQAAGCARSRLFTASIPNPAKCTRS
jgi:hypothetical protein